VDYFRAMGIPLLRGRDFTDQDHLNAPRVAVINEALARRFFPDEDPIGKQIAIGGGGPRQIVGIAGSVRHDKLRRLPEVAVYVPYRQSPTIGVTLIARTARDPAALIPAMRAAVHSVDPELAVFGIRTLEDIRHQSTFQERYTALLLGAAALLAVLLAAVGIYGVMSYHVELRAREIGVRMALGARESDVLRLIVGQGMTLAIAGLAAGVLLALAVTRVLSSMLYSVSAADPATFAAVTLFLAAVALTANYVPARRAMRVDPLVALREE
jgi:putative ABC transport system permease protein